MKTVALIALLMIGCMIAVPGVVRGAEMHEAEDPLVVQSQTWRHDAPMKTRGGGHSHSSRCNNDRTEEHYQF
ncbi:hypothetical protein M514_03827 [Trichuris suis]|uniref:Secreted protein n=1 Tax=Trichuris suis TaxID=68888 RepID=A0A085N7J1_9BILA|nr:hypothetical protein M513_03827 [Trichuris suis]KFD65437.1 hypothetical protein M514_03827 [Trichuris suis]KHJ45260.1 hypothetical protein D918_04564 [Trichuris suis]